MRDAQLNQLWTDCRLNAEELKRQELPDPLGEGAAWRPWLEWTTTFHDDVQIAIDCLLAAEGARSLTNQAFSRARMPLDRSGYDAATLKDVGLEAVLAATVRNVNCT